MQQRVGAEAHVVLDDDVRADAAAVTDDGVGADHAVRSEQHVRAERGGLMHDGGRVALAPLGKAFALAVEVLEQQRHSHRHVLDRKAAAEGGLDDGDLVGDVALHDEDRGPAFARGGQLRHVADEDEAVGTRAARHVAVRGSCVEIAVQVREDVRMPALDRVCIEHGVLY